MTTAPLLVTIMSGLIGAFLLIMLCFVCDIIVKIKAWFCDEREAIKSADEHH